MITKEEIHQRAKKMSSEELQQHLKNVKAGVGIRKNKKKYNRKSKYRDSY